MEAVLCSGEGVGGDGIREGILLLHACGMELSQQLHTGFCVCKCFRVLVFGFGIQGSRELSSWRLLVQKVSHYTAYTHTSCTSLSHPVTVKLGSVCCCPLSIVPKALLCRGFCRAW